MPEGGILTITTKNLTLESEQLTTHTGKADAGDYVRLAVSDTGIGMTPEVISKALDPFYTTKPPGAGTGLGLATVYGVLSKADGQLQITSLPGQGATIETYWPASATCLETVPAGSAVTQSQQQAAGGETILVVEDEEALLSIAVRILGRHGYTILSASRPSDAIERAARHDGTIELLITDIVMPEAPGTEVAKQLQASRPSLRVIYTSGYMPNANELPTGAAFLPKPYSGEQLLSAVADSLHGQQAATA